MNQDQLQKARLTRWRQDGNALLTLDDAERWLAETPLCLYLPRYQHLPVPAPSFVEAVAGRPDPTPEPAAISTAASLLSRLVASGAAVALNLIGSPAGVIGEQPDFLATPEALPYLYALQPQRNPKKAPTTTGAARVSPLAAEAFAILTREGALTAAELRERLGREVTKAAVLRALGELWHAMRVAPIPQADGAPAHWELLATRHRQELNAGSTQSQTTALSVLVSFYLQSAIAATAEETEIFLSPLAARSRIQDVLRGLTATRQLASFSLNGAAELYVDGTLPEIAEEEAAMSAEEEASSQSEADLEEAGPVLSQAEDAAPRRPAARTEQLRPRFADRARGGFKSPPRRPREGGYRRPEQDEARRERPAAASGEEKKRFRSGDESARPPRRLPFERSDRPRTDRPTFRKPGYARPAAGDAAGKPRFEKRDAGERRPPRRDGEERRPYPRDNERKPFTKRPFSKDRAPRQFDRERTSERPPQREGGFRSRSSEERGPRREGVERKPFAKRPFSQDRSPRPFGGARPPRGEGSFRARGSEDRGAQRPGGARRPFRGDGEVRPPYPRGGGEGKPFAKRPFTKNRAPRPVAKDGESRPFTARSPRSFDREGSGARPPRREGGFRPRNAADRGPREGGFRPRRPAEGVSSQPGGERRPFRPAAKRIPSGPGGASRGGRPSGAGGFERKGPVKPRFGGAKPFNRSAKPIGKSGKPFGKSGKPFGKPGSRPFGKTSGSAPPRRKPRRDSGEGNEG